MTKPLAPHHVGSDFDAFLDEQGLLAEAEAVAVKRVVAWQVEQQMQAQGISKSDMARRMQTSRAAVDRLLDPESPSVTLLTLEKAARVLGRTLSIELTTRPT
ncbi:MAG: helix-turn-helix domain-containing protein [Myxococcota bacterium]|jgi:antitoxin HicB